MALRILVVDDHNLMREGLRLLAERNPDMTVVGDAADGRSAVRLAKELAPDVILMDIGMPDLNGIEATRQILATAPNTHILVVSMHCDKRIVPEAIKAGALGFVPKDADAEELMTAIRTVAEGRAYLSVRVSSALVDGLAGQSDPAATSRPQLTSREKEIVQLLAEGNAMKEIAATLHISVKTVEAHRRRVMKKMGLGGTAALTKFAVREGLTHLE